MGKPGQNEVMAGKNDPEKLKYVILFNLRSKSFLGG